MTAHTFQHDYDPSAAILIRPRDRCFDMEVTPRYRLHFVERSFESLTADLVANLAARHPLFIDVGAHYGFFTLLVGTLHPDAEILALEPVPTTCAILRRNLERHQLRTVRLVEAAASDLDGRGTLNISAASDSCSFYPHPAAPPISRLDVPTVRLDTLLSDHPPCPALIKIDTDGHELAVLDGLRRTLDRFPDLSLIIEFNPKMQRQAGHAPETLLETLDRLGFDSYILDDRTRQAVKTPHPQDWMKHVEPEGYANLYCPRKTRSLSVCVFSHSSHLTGAERSLLELVTELVRDHGIVSTVVLPDEGPLSAELSKVGAACLHTPYGWWCARQPAEVAALTANLGISLENILGAILPALRRINPDLIVTNTMVIPWGAIAARLLEKPHVWNICEHGRLGYEFHFVHPHDRVLACIEQTSALICVPSNMLRRHLFPHLGEDRCRTLPRHVSIPPADPGRPVRELYRRPGTIKLGVFGTLCEEKGQADAVHALPVLIRLGHDVELFMAGHADPAYVSSLQRQILEAGVQDHVGMSDFIDDVYDAIRQTDIVLICSRFEAFGRVALEAMLLRRPVVYAAAGALLDYMEDGKTGLAYPPGDSAILAARIDTLLRRPDLKHTLTTEGYRLATTRFTRDRFGGQCAEALRTLRKTKPRPTPEGEALLAEALGWMSDRLHQGVHAAGSPASLAPHESDQTPDPQTELAAIKATLSWRLLCAYWRSVERLFPAGTRRRRLLDRLTGLMKGRPGPG